MAEQVTIAGKELKCVICENNTFNKFKIKLNNRGVILWKTMATSGTAYVCDSCGLSHDFYK